jgi:hypothetical protein
LLAPTLDGEDTSYFEWLGAGCLEVRDVGGAMHQADHRVSLLTLVRFGFDRERLFVRLDATTPIIELLATGYELSLKFLKPDGMRFSVKETMGRVRGTYWDLRSNPARWLERGPGAATVAAGTVLELAVPLADLGADRDLTELSFVVAVYDADSTEVERHPAHRPIEVATPDDAYEARHWTA